MTRSEKKIDGLKWIINTTSDDKFSEVDRIVYLRYYSYKNCGF